MVKKVDYTQQDMARPGIASSSSPNTMQLDDIQNITLQTRDRQFSLAVGNDWRQQNDGATSSASNPVVDAVINAFTSGNWQETKISMTPDVPYEYSPKISKPTSSCVSSAIQSYITYATKEYHGEMIELCVCCVGKEAKIWYINIPSFQHYGRDITAVDLPTAITDLSMWLQDIARPLLFVGFTEYIGILKSIKQQNKCDEFKAIVEGFTFTDPKLKAFKDIFDKREIITLENEKDPGFSAAKLAEILEGKIGTRGRCEILEILAKNSRTFTNALELSIYKVKVEESLNSEFENKSLATLMSRGKLRKDIGKKIASIGFNYEDICVMYRQFKLMVGVQPKKLMYQAFQDRDITTSTDRVDGVIEMLENDGN